MAGRCSISGEHTLEFLLAFNGRIHHLEQGYWIKFEIARVSPTPHRPHGLRYAFTLHDPEGRRLVGFDNAHPLSSESSGFKSKAPGHDHWHRDENDKGRAYQFTNADSLLADFEAEIIRVLNERGIAYCVIATSETKKGRRP